MKRWVLGLLLVLPASGCYRPDRPLCSYSCGDGGICPEDYVCLSDGYCHLNGNPQMCEFPPPPDASSDSSSGD